MTKAQLLKKIAYLEFVQDQLSTELDYVDHLLRNLGFPYGLESAKLVAQELIENEEYHKQQGNELKEEGEEERS